MKWLSGRKNGKLNVEWQYETDGVLWRLLPSPNGFFVGEDRNIENKKTTFFCIDRNSGLVRWKNIKVDEDWWVSIEAIHDDIVFLHEYANPSMPDHKKIYALSLSTGDLLWRNDTLKFEFAAGESVYASREECDRRIFVNLDLLTGKELSELDPSQVHVLREMNQAKSDTAIDLPQIFAPDTMQNTELAERIHKACSLSKNAVLVEYLEKNDALMVAYYDNISSDLMNPELRQHIVILSSKRGNILYNDVMNNRSNIPVPDLFFCSQDFLYYVKDQKILKAIRISSALN